MNLADALKALREAGMGDGSIQVLLMPDGQTLRVFIRGHVVSRDVHGLDDQPATPEGLATAVSNAVSQIRVSIRTGAPS